MRAIRSSSLPGWAMGLQSASNTGRTASGIEYREEALRQRQAEEARRQQAFELDLAQAQERVRQRDAQQQFQFQQAQGLMERQRLFEQMQGNQSELGRVEALAKELSPENAELFLRDYQDTQARQVAMRGLQSLGQEVMRPMQEGLIEDPQTQQQLGLLQQTMEQMGQMIDSGGLDPNDAPRLFDNLMSEQRQILQSHTKRQAERQLREKAAVQVEERLSQTPAGVKHERLAELAQQARLGLVSPKDVGKALIAEEFELTPEDVADVESGQWAMPDGRFSFGYQPPQGPQPDIAPLRQALEAQDFDAFESAAKELGLTPEQIEAMLSG